MSQVVLITGADRGLGFALTKDFLAWGDVVFAGQFMEEWGELEELQGNYPDRLHRIPLDVSDRASIEKAFRIIGEKTDRLDMLVNNAGISGSGEESMDRRYVQEGVRVFRTNCLGPLLMVRTFLPLMKKDGAGRRLCFVSSEAGSISVCHREGGFLYTMSKAGLNMTVRLLKEELMEQGFTFRLYHPGWMRSYMQGKKNLEGKIEPEESSGAAVAFFTGEQKREYVLRMVDNEGTVWPF